MSLSLKNDSEYAGTRGGTNWWRWTAYVECTPPDSLDDILYVEYHLHPTFQNPVKRIRKGNGGFRLERKGWGTFELRARVVFKKPDDAPVILIHFLELEDPPSHPHEIPA